MSLFFSLRRHALAVLFLGLASSFALVAAPATPEDSEAAEKQPKPKCQVCHNNPRNPHTITIACKAMAKHLQKHPGDYEGPCQNVSDEKPPKPSPTPKPNPHH